MPDSMLKTAAAAVSMVALVRVLTKSGHKEAQQEQLVGTFLGRLGNMHTEASLQHGLSFECRKSDAFIVRCKVC